MPRRSTLEILKDLRRYASLEEASFGFPGQDFKIPKNHKEHDEYIKEVTRLHRESWILPLIDQLMEREARTGGGTQVLNRLNTEVLYVTSGNGGRWESGGSPVKRGVLSRLKQAGLIDQVFDQWIRKD